MSDGVVIVGGGPAGMAAAQALAEYQIPVTLLEESAFLGGRYYKQPSAAQEVSRTTELDELAEQGRAHIAALAESAVSVQTDTLVWGMFADNQVATFVDGRAETLKPRAVILATGAVERLAAFPGWTLPGVVSAGGVQTILSRDGIVAGQRFVVAGTGPLLLAIALEIEEAGGQVVGVVEGSGRSAPLRQIHHFLGQRRRLRHALDYEVALRQRNVPIHRGHLVVRAAGDNAVEEVIAARIDRDWHVVEQTETRISADTLCLHYGFAASTELARMCECDVTYAPDRGGWYVVHDDEMRSSRKDIYVSGQLTGIAGADVAEATGRLAGLSAAHDLGVLGAQRYRELSSDLQREIERGRQFMRALNTTYAPMVGVSDPITPETLLCRCEELSAADIDNAIQEGANTLNDIKRRTRCGMGLCQSRICAPVVTGYLASKGIAPETAGLITARPPVRPIPVGALATLSEHEVPGEEA